MNKILGIDLGTNSVGWALRNPDLIGNQIEKFGVLTFNKGVGSGKTGEYSYAAERTKKRSVRRLYQARKYRLWATLQHLIEGGYCPLSIEALNKWRHYSKEEARRNNNAGRVYPVDHATFDAWIKLDFNNDGRPDYTSPYQLRKELSEVQLSFSREENKFKLGRALYHIAQRRGFKSSRKGSDDVKEREVNEDGDVMDLQYSERKKNKKIVELFEKYPQAKTIGALFALLENDKIRIRESVAQYAIRENYKDEIKYICQVQGFDLGHSLYTKLVETASNRNDGSIFYKRPLRSQKGLVGRCTLQPNKYRAPISHPLFETFRAWTFLNNVKYRSKGDSHWNALPLELKKRIYDDKFFRKSRSYFPFSEIADVISASGNKWELNYKPKTSVTACPVSARLKEIFGENYMQLRIPKEQAPKSNKAYYDLEDVWHVLFSYEDQEFVAEFAEQKLKLSPEKVKQFVTAWNALPVGYGMLSLNAIRKINRFLEQGLIYTEAVLLANVPEIIGAKIWEGNENYLLESIGQVIENNRQQKVMLSIVNGLISKYKNLNAEEKFGYKDNDYQLDSSDTKEIQKAIEEQFGKSKWDGLSREGQETIFGVIKDCYQAFFTSSLARKDINGDRHFVVRSFDNVFYKTDSGYYRLPKVIDTLGEFLQANFNVSDASLGKIYHPSEISMYPPATVDGDGVLKLGSPKTGSFKNPMAMRALHELRKLMNYMIVTNQIDSDTRVVVEVARELNDSNKRWAIEAWQRQREAENHEFAKAIEQLTKETPHVAANHTNEVDIDKMRLWYEQSEEEETVPPIADAKKEIKGIKWSDNRKGSYKQIIAQKNLIDKYRLWKEQGCQCIYTGRVIGISDLFNENVIDFEHTVPRSQSFDNSLANLTVCYADYNRNIKKNRIPTQLDNYDTGFGEYSAILPRLEKWKEKVERIKQQIDFWKTKSKKTTDKQWRDDAIRQRHLWQMELDYWRNKLDRFTIMEITNGFKNSQKVDTQLISKYAFHYLKTYFNKVDVQKGSITAEFRKIYQLQVADQKKDRSKHSHHAKDAAVLTLIPIAAKRDAILEKYYKAKESQSPFNDIEPYKGFKREFVWSIDDNVLINNITNNQTLSPSKRKIRKRGKEQLIPGTNNPMWATGDSIRGQLHQETFYGAIRLVKRDEHGTLQKDENGKFIQEDKIKYVVRIPFQYKKDTNSVGFRNIEEIEKIVVDDGLRIQIKKQVEEAGGLKEAFDKGIYLLDRNGKPHGSKIRHIRVWASVSEPIAIKKQANLSKAEYKQHYWAANATNSYFALYKSEGKKDFDFRTLFETSKFLSTRKIKVPNELFEPFIEIKKGKSINELPLVYVLEVGSRVLFKSEGEEDLKGLSIGDLLKRLYVYTGFEKNGNSARLNFRYHLEARNKIEEEYVESDIDFDRPKPKLRFGYAKYDFWVEDYDFQIEMDGTIKWLK